MAEDPPGGAVPLHRALGLTDAEADAIVEILGRSPNHLELAMYSVMWSEHCSYKSSRIHLGRLPTTAPHVLVGPGEGAGVVDVGDKIAAAFRIESHNHPSAIEPYQGAATGVGGILRDIFSVGARPIALMDPLRFGPLSDPRSRWIAEGVVSGVSGYGNSVGVPTVGGETVFDETYQDNPLVNVFCLGLLPHDRLMKARASGTGNLTVLFGSSTGRDGIGGASVLASAGFGTEEDDADKRPSVQVGDPFEEKRLIEACLQMLDAGLVVGIQDLGAAGITGAASETASKGGVGMDLHLADVHVREQGMEPFEIMTSESQERMLAIVEPGNLAALLAICARWEVTASVIGTVTGTGRFRVLDRVGGEVLADIPASSLDDDAPRYERPLAAPADLAARRADKGSLAPPDDVAADLLGLLTDPLWVYSQYDHQLFLNTVEGPGGDASVLRLKHPMTGVDTGRGLALTCDGNHRWCALDPHVGTALVVAEAVLNLACVGARPLGLVNCLNFGNPEHPEVMWQLSAAIDGMAEAVPGLRPAGRGRQRQPLQREPRPRHRPDPRRRRARHRRPPRPAAPRGAPRRSRLAAGARPGDPFPLRFALGLGAWPQVRRRSCPRPRRARGAGRPRPRPGGGPAGCRRARRRRRARRGAGGDGRAQRQGLPRLDQRRRPRMALRRVGQPRRGLRGQRPRRRGPAGGPGGRCPGQPHRRRRRRSAGGRGPRRRGPR